MIEPSANGVTLAADIRAGLGRIRNTWTGIELINAIGFTCFVGFLCIWVIPAAVALRNVVNQQPKAAIASQPRSIDQTSPADSLEAFQHSFPPATLILNFTRQLSQIADKSGAQVVQAEYRPASDPSGLRRFETTLNLHGSYPMIRRFLSSMLTELPTVTLDGLTMSRLNSTDTSIDSQLKLSIYLAPE